MLTDTEIRALKPREKIFKTFDGGGLYLQTTPKGGRLWRLKYRFAGREKLLALGTYPDTSLKLARTKRENAKALLAQDIDPGVGCELVFKPQLVIDIYHGSVLASGNCPGERPCGPFYQFFRLGELRRVLGEHDLRCSTFETEVISYPDHEHSRKEPDRDILDEPCRSVFRQMDETTERMAQSSPPSHRESGDWRSIGEIETADRYRSEGIGAPWTH